MWRFVHHLCATCFRHEGHSMHGEGNAKSVALQELQAAIVSRHRLGSSGMEEAASEKQIVPDYA